MDFSKTKFRASSFGSLMSEPVNAADKAAGKLGLTAQKELVKIYNKIVYDWEAEDKETKETRKGTKVQTDSIRMYSVVEGKIFEENFEQLENQFFSGKPDLFFGESIRKATQVDDIKNSWSLETFGNKIVETINKDFIYQLNVYFDLTGATAGNIVHTLMSLPEEDFLQECKYLQTKMVNSGNYISDLSQSFIDDYEAGVEKLKKLHLYDHIDPRERVFKQPVPRNDELIQKMKDKVPVLRNWLKNYHEIRMNQYPKN